ncbi:hypothetical protein HHJ81_09395 [Mobiluncus mulieris]|uniref:Uncharacterized protein n=2 Tax=Mobiluncus mulieris TaxID=2052 RepID=E0QN89_9ACTO|nr:hypothetical protein [Mobiluncus mulieris]EEJ52983.1 hypothetical protein HMPREF0577_1994 [Mobiluncus mulieris ATCC 35243]EFM46861.1 hypothetical protein HMPREF0580_0353 [Mobiluncus mulieris ATCC 35239]MBB5847221.1 hypothetical protein [Mobiluncus mulieris]MCU9971808.1 hypothetical protein [Mobiluncus mulieris]MCU9975038.1 hypothetical protein [Mobiluncus mulieris]
MRAYPTEIIADLADPTGDKSLLGRLAACLVDAVPESKYWFLDAYTWGEDCFDKVYRLIDIAATLRATIPSKLLQETIEYMSHAREDVNHVFLETVETLKTKIAVPA